jgi:hypothetical protein
VTTHGAAARWWPGAAGDANDSIHCSPSDSSGAQGSTGGAAAGITGSAGACAASAGACAPSCAPGPARLARKPCAGPRGVITTLAGGDWLRHARNLLITGATGSGKTWLACALAHQAARSGFSVLYVRAARLFDELQVAHGDGSFARRLAALAKLDLIVIDDFAISPMGPAERNDLLELLDDRIGTRSTLITSQLPIKAWHTYLNDPTLADAILDRVVHSSHKIELKGTRSMRDADAAAVT